MDGRGYPLYFVSQVEDITERKLLEEKLQTRSVTDDLTGLYNRRGFFELCQEKLSIASRRNERLLLLFVDLDHMKWINDTLGHDEGDAALIAVAQTLRDTFRGSDIIGRIGGDEFAILAVGPSEDAENTFLTRLQDNLTTFNKTNDRRDFPISVSAGISRYEPIEPCSLEALSLKQISVCTRLNERKALPFLSCQSDRSGHIFQGHFKAILVQNRVISWSFAAPPRVCSVRSRQRISVERPESNPFSMPDVLRRRDQRLHQGNIGGNPETTAARRKAFS